MGEGAGQAIPDINTIGGRAFRLKPATDAEGSRTSG